MLPLTLQQRIATIQAQYPNNLEVEVRYGTFSSRGFQPGVTIQTFSRLQNNLGKIAPVTIQKSRDEFYAQGRRSLFDSGEELWISKKEPLLKEDIPEYGLRISAVQEIPLTPLPRDTKPNYTREKIRYSYLLAGGAVRADLTRVQANERFTYEVELELVIPTQLELLSRTAELILKIVQDTYILYTEKDRREVTGYFNFLLTGKREESRLDHNVLKQARNLKMRDMVWGGLIGNERTGYVVSHKVDGTRRLLVFAPNGIWLLHPPHEYTRLTAGNFPTMTGTILDGELVPKEKRKAQAPKNTYWCIVFDTLAWQGDIDVQKQPYSDRMALAQLGSDRVDSPVLHINTRSFTSFNTPEKFFEVMRRMFAQQATLAYEHDGFIFTAENAEYDPKVDTPEGTISIDKVPLWQRTLTTYPDGLKWKPLENLTIDFLIRRSPRGIELYTSDKGTPIPFTGSRTWPLSGIVTRTTPLLEETPDESIVEFRWEDGAFVPVVVRTNKVRPNRLEIATDIWEDIHRPITRELLTGEGFGLFDYYHERIRKGLLYTPSQEETLLVLYPQMGEEMGAWKNYRRIVAFQPDPKVREELAIRVKNLRLDNKVRLVETPEAIGSAVKDFLGGSAQVIALMQSSPGLAEIISTSLDPKGRFLFHILDGDAVQEMFRPALTPQFDLTALQLGSSVLTYNPEVGTLLTNHPGTQLEDKEEVPTFIYDLLGAGNLYLAEIHRADTEDFLSLAEKTLSRMYSFGLAQTTPPLAIKEKTVPIELGIRKEQVTSPKLVQSPAVTVTATSTSIKTKPTPVTTRALPTRPSLKRLPVRTKGPTSEYPLGTLTVQIPRNKNMPGVGDDKVEKLTVTWTDEEVSRIACIGDGSCFFHAFLKGFYAPYQNQNGYNFRTELVRNFRDELAALIVEEDPANPGLLFYQTAANGEWQLMAEEQNAAIKLREEEETRLRETLKGKKLEEALRKAKKDDFNLPLDYSIEGIVDLFLSNRDVGDEVYSFVSEIVGVGVYILRGTNKNLYPQISVGIEHPSVVIVGNGVHYEVIAVKRQDGLQTFFDPDDPFLVSLRNYKN
jgi:hypothetical protein